MELAPWIETSENKIGQNWRNGKKNEISERNEECRGSRNKNGYGAATAVDNGDGGGGHRQKMRLRQQIWMSFSEQRREIRKTSQPVLNQLCKMETGFLFMVEVQFFHKMVWVFKYGTVQLVVWLWLTRFFEHP